MLLAESLVCIAFHGILPETFVRSEFQPAMLYIFHAFFPKVSFPQSVDNFHQSPEGNDTVAPFYKHFFAEFPGVKFDIQIIRLSVLTEVLYGKCDAIRFIHIQQPQDPVMREKARGDDFRNMFLFHPKQPFFRYFIAYLTGHIIDDHAPLVIDTLQSWDLPSKIDQDKKKDGLYQDQSVNFTP
jgi:hypothetical protein